jgi:hypothetical protein
VCVRRGYAIKEQIYRSAEHRRAPRYPSGTDP